jgi:peptidyl-prolyl cis-trans isomerase D
MALIGSIRQRSGLLVGIIAVSIVGFLVMDATNSQFSVLKGGRSNAVGKVNGEKILYTDYMKNVDENVKNLETRMGKSGQVDEEQKNAIRQQTWEDLVNTAVMNKTYEKLGVNVTDDEMVELTTGQNVHPYVRQNFTNPQTGQFDPAQVKYFIQNLDQDDKGTEPGTRRRSWSNFEKEIKKMQISQKYITLVSKGLYAPTWLAEKTYEESNKTADFRYIEFPFTDVNDADLKITDDELKGYLKNHAALFNQDEESRKIQYVSFDIAASRQDSLNTEKYLAEKVEEFKAGAKTETDSSFVKLYSENQFDNLYYTKEQLAGNPLADSLFSLPVKTVVGPYVDGAFYKVAKITGRKMLSDSVRVRDIIFSFENVKTNEEANAKRKLFDSIFTQIDSFKKDFAEMAALYSDDQASKVKGGDIGWIKQGQVEKGFNDAIFFFMNKGQVSKTATQSALHIIQVIDDSPSKTGVQVAYLTKSIVPSPETERAIYSQASKFAADNQTEAKFKEAAKKANGKSVDVKKSDFNVMGLTNARELVRWAYNAKKGDVSSIVTVDKKHAIAYLESIRVKGLPDLDAVKEDVKLAYTKEKKFELLSKKVTDAKAATIDDLAAKFGKAVLQADKASILNPGLATGYEPAVVAAGVYAAQGKLSAPVLGNGGVYVVQKIGGVDPPKATDLTMYKGQLQQQLSRKSNRAVEALKKLANIEDSRSEFF